MQVGVLGQVLFSGAGVSCISFCRRSNQKDPAPVVAVMLQTMEGHIGTLTGSMGAMERVRALRPDKRTSRVPSSVFFFGWGCKGKTQTRHSFANPLF